MGNWRTVRIVGTCDKREVLQLHQVLEPGLNYENFHPLVSGGLSGLPNWAGETIDVIGNLAERNYDAEDVARTLKRIAKIAPSLKVKVHVGGDHEDKRCVATVSLIDGEVNIGPPEVEDVGEISEQQMESQYIKSLLRWHLQGRQLPDNK